MGDLFAAYVRTSTDDNQSPEDSKRWQLALAEQLIAPKKGSIGAIYHDTNTSRSLPWTRRRRAKDLLEDLADPHRGWNKLVIGEPQRAFAGAQFQLVFPILCHYGVELWVPEVGGPIDPDSEAHDLVMSLFGGLSKAERRRVQHRTRASMLALATTGRWLGGRTNYGYQLIDTDLPHPNKRKASAGARLRTLEPDPDTAQVVRRIFTMCDAGTGLRSIARTLEDEGIPSPGEVGPTIHPRSAGVWGGAAVRAILLNPRYLGHQVAGRLRRQDVLLDPRDPAQGTTSRQRWQPTQNWSWSEEPAWPALIDEDLFRRVNAKIKNNHYDDGTQTLKPRSEPGRYLLSGRMRCGHCGKSMHGLTGKGKPYYRCDATRSDYARPAVEGHPANYTIREERIIATIDDWLATTFTDPDIIDTTIASILEADRNATEEPPDVTIAREQLVRSQTELNRLLAAIRAGMDPELAAPETRKIQADLANAKRAIAAWQRAHGRPALLTETQARSAVSRAGDLVRLLRTADRTVRTALYSALGLTISYTREAPTGLERVHARLELRSNGNPTHETAQPGPSSDRVALRSSGDRI